MSTKTVTRRGGETGGASSERSRSSSHSPGNKLRTSQASRYEHEIENKNVSFINARGFWLFYAFLILILRLAFWLIPIVPQTHATSIIHIIHAVLSFRLLHWNRGSIVVEDTGEYEELTFWEQIDEGTQFTGNRKLFTLIPIFLFLWAEYESGWQVEMLVINSIALAILLIGKSPYMHRVRILGINSSG